MDAPLVLTSILNPSEVDDMVFDMDIAAKYPLEFYEACEQFKNPWDVKIDQISNHLGKPTQYFGMGFTHPSFNINSGVRCSAYKTLPSRTEKVAKQRGTLFLQHSTVDLESMIESRAFGQVDDAANGASLGIVCAENKPRNSRLYDRTDTHRARFQCDIQSRAR